MKNKKTLETAYFSMEIAFAREVPNYAGGLGVLAADMLYSCADMGSSVVGVSLIYHQKDDPNKAFPISKYLKKCQEEITVRIEDRDVKVAIWRLDIKGKKGRVPVFFLSTHLPENEPWDRNLTKNIYASDGYTRLCQETILGVGGVRALRALGYGEVRHYHMNEGHCSFLPLELLRENNYDEDKVRALCSFTTHTPIASGHDYFDYGLAYRTIGGVLTWDIKELAGQDRLGMTQLALSLSANANGVSKRHAEVCREMFPGREFKAITNGVYHGRWTGKYMTKLFNRSLKNWKNQPDVFSLAPDLISDKKLIKARRKEKKELVKWINSNRGFISMEHFSKEDMFSEEILTIGFARRFIPYKRPELIFFKKEILEKIGDKKLQLVFASHCHPAHDFCNDAMRDIIQDMEDLRGKIKIIMIPEYNLEISKKLVSGCDVWLNTPIPPREASGTSGMKAALNGCLNLSIGDGWWIEGQKAQPMAGWTFGTKTEDEKERDERDAQDLMEKLKDVIACYYSRKEEWVERMKSAIALGGYFNTHRVCREYEEEMWKVKDKK